MARAELSPEEESALIVRMMRERGVPEPGVLGNIVPVWAIGLANSAWRNTLVEDWHAGTGPLSDGDMMRINSATTHGIQQRLAGWMREYDIDAGDPTDVLDDFDLEDIEDLAARIHRWLTRPDRRLPTGMTLVELAEAAGDSVENYAEAAGEALDGFLDMADERGAAFAFLRCAAHGTAACEHWWNHPRWPAHVNAFIAEVTDPGDKYAGQRGPRPAQIEDSEVLRSRLLTRPWELDGDSARWVVNAGIRYVRPRA